MKKLKELYNLTDSIFTDLQSLDVPWKNKNISQKLDIAYMGNQSGNKWASPLLEQFIDENGEISAQDRGTIASVVFALNNENWSKLYATMSFEYDPIENYSMVEQMTNDNTVTQYGKTNTRTNNLTHAKTGTEQTAYASTDTRTDNLTHAKTGTEQTAYASTDTRTDNLTHTKAGAESVTRNDQNTKRDQATLTKEGSETLSKNNTKTIDGGETRTPNLNTSNSVYAFNSTTPSPTTVSANNGTETTQFLNRSDTEQGTETSSFNNRVDRNNAINEESRNSTETTNYTNRVDTDGGTSANAKTGNDTLTHNTSETDTGTSANAKTGNDTLTHNTSETDTGTQVDANSGSDTSTRNYRLTRSGNIGVTTSQQMIESERNLWLWNFFYKVVFPDVDRVLTLNIY